MEIKRPVPGDSGHMTCIPLTEAELNEAYRTVHDRMLMTSAEKYFRLYCLNSSIPPDGLLIDDAQKQAYLKTVTARFEQTACDSVATETSWIAAVDNTIEPFFHKIWAGRLLASAREDKAKASAMAVLISTLTPDDDPIPDSLADYLDRELPFPVIVKLMQAVVWGQLQAVDFSKKEDADRDTK